MNDLRGKVNVLNIRKRDLISRKEEELRHRKVVREEVKHWFNAIEKVNTEMEKIETKFHNVSYFLRGRLGKFVCRMIEKVEEIHQKGSFPDGPIIQSYFVIFLVFTFALL
ncbi:Uncharacterized protein TCM_031206 [Theobroma cacao]|uniref:Uncharacterized protein n=1 Tax=Theobroma cacao TaxID=3641 RepID=A0A061F758_THECC|nr:Uncharacterized protein TCM_031206 [Theobroma cacao]